MKNFQNLDCFGIAAFFSENLFCFYFFLTLICVPPSQMIEYIFSPLTLICQKSWPSFPASTFTDTGRSSAVFGLAWNFSSCFSSHKIRSRQNHFLNKYANPNLHCKIKINIPLIILYYFLKISYAQNLIKIDKSLKNGN